KPAGCRQKARPALPVSGQTAGGVLGELRVVECFLRHDASFHKKSGKPSVVAFRLRFLLILFVLQPSPAASWGGAVRPASRASPASLGRAGLPPPRRWQSRWRAVPSRFG